MGQYLYDRHTQRQQVHSTAIVPGSITHYANQRNQSFALAWLAVQAIVIFDRSASMDDADAPGGQTRYQLAISELANLQAQCPGRVAIVQFNDTVSLVPGGVPESPAGTTDLAAALRFVKSQRMDIGTRIIVISDGEPNCERSALEMAGAFRTRIDVVYCGPATRPEGREFLNRLALTSGGQLVTADRAQGLMAATVRLLGVGV